MREKLQLQYYVYVDRVEPNELSYYTW